MNGYTTYPIQTKAFAVWMAENLELSDLMIARLLAIRSSKSILNWRRSVEAGTLELPPVTTAQQAQLRAMIAGGDGVNEDHEETSMDEPAEPAESPEEAPQLPAVVDGGQVVVVEPQGAAQAAADGVTFRMVHADELIDMDEVLRELADAKAKLVSSEAMRERQAEEWGRERELLLSQIDEEKARTVLWRKRAEAFEATTTHLLVPVE